MARSQRTRRCAARARAAGRPAAAPAPAVAPTLALALMLGACGGGGGTSYETGGTAAAESAEPAVAVADAPPQNLAPIEAAPVAGAPLSGTPVGSTPTPVAPARPATVAPDGTPDALGQFQDDPTRLEPLPEPAAREVTDSGLQIAYLTEAQRAAIEPDWIEAQWQHMQSCTTVVAAPPLVLIVEGRARPITPRDEVVLAIDGSALATASVGASGTTLQVSDADLMPGAPDRGFALRAITGRWLWQGDNRPARDYPFECAVEGP